MTVDSVSSITRGEGALNAARLGTENAKFSELLNKIQSKNTSTLSSAQIAKDGRLTGDCTSGFDWSRCKSSKSQHQSAYNRQDKRTL